MLATVKERISNWNPQLVREIKGRWKGRNLVIAVGASLLSQALIYLGFREELPKTANHMNRYCVGTPPADELSAAQFHNPPNNYCLENAAGNFVINWELWWLDVFTWLSVSFLIVLLVAGTYVLISDLSQEQQKGTLSFVRLTPRSVTNLLAGKILGVPILIYTVMLLAFPLHLWAGMAAKIPVSLILGWDLAVIASCIFFYSVALLYGLVTTGFSGMQSWFGTGIVFVFLLMATKAGYSNALVNHNPFDWLSLFYPGKLLPYLIGETPHSLDTIGYFNLKETAALKWYGLPLWNNAYSAIALLIVNYAWWTYWAWQGLQRCFRNAHATLFSKQKSFWFTGSITVSLLGFMYPEAGDPDYVSHELLDNFHILFGIEVAVFLFLIAALSPHRQTLQDWARYRYQKNDKQTRNLLADLMRGEYSPANGAIALNLIANGLLITVAIGFLPLENHRLSLLGMLLLTGSALLIYASIAQLFLLMKTPKRSLFATVAVSTLMVVPGMLGTIVPLPQMVSLTFFPIAANAYIPPTLIFFTLAAQWVVIISCNIQLTRQLKKAGASSTKSLFSEPKTTPRRLPQNAQ